MEPLSAERSTTADQINMLYKMVFPYRNGNPNAVMACAELKIALKNMCTPEMRIPLIMIGRIMGLKYNPGTPLSVICPQIQDYLINTCLDYPSEAFRTSLTHHWATGALPHIDDSQVCREVFTQTPLLAYTTTISQNIKDQVVMGRISQPMGRGRPMSPIENIEMVVSSLLLNKMVSFTLLLRGAGHISEILGVQDINARLSETDKEGIRKYLSPVHSIHPEGGIYDTIHTKVGELMFQGIIPLDISKEELCRNIQRYLKSLSS